MQIQISWLLHKPTDLDLHRLIAKTGYVVFSKRRVKECCDDSVECSTITKVENMFYIAGEPFCYG